MRANDSVIISMREINIQTHLFWKIKINYFTNIISLIMRK